MSTNRKGRAGWHQTTPKTSKRVCHSTGLAAHVKGVIVSLALWGWLLLGLASWINGKGEPHDE